MGLILNITGLILLFIGNMLVSNALTKWGSAKLPGYIWGNRLQGVGFVLSLLGIYIEQAQA